MPVTLYIKLYLVHTAVRSPGSSVVSLFAIIIVLINFENKHSPRAGGIRELFVAAGLRESCIDFRRVAWNYKGRGGSMQFPVAWIIVWSNLMSTRRDCGVQNVDTLLLIIDSSRVSIRGASETGTLFTDILFSMLTISEP